MKLENSFEVPALEERRVGSPDGHPARGPVHAGRGAQETVSETHWKAEMAVKLGPIALTFDTDVTRKAIDEAGEHSHAERQAPARSAAAGVPRPRSSRR